MEKQNRLNDQWSEETYSSLGRFQLLELYIILKYVQSKKHIWYFSPVQKVCRKGPDLTMWSGFSVQVNGFMWNLSMMTLKVTVIAGVY